ncbi:MAG: hypothetical protein WDZ52_09295 [Pseudohongiellaceae bacterium]
MTPWISLTLALAILAVILGGLYNRNKPDKTGKVRGIGWQFIRYTVIGVGLPLTGILALNGSLTGEASTIIAGALGYAFGKQSEPSS